MDAARTTGFRERFRRQLRDDILATAYRVTCERGWASVTNTVLAREVGISRQTIYKEFGTRMQVGEAMLLREAELLIALATRTLNAEILRRDPGLDRDEVEGTTDALIRLVVSHLLRPAEDPEATAARLTRLACRGLQV